MRFFIAVTPPPTIHKSILLLQKHFQNLGLFSFTHDHHITLQFLGEVSPTSLTIIQAKLKTVHCNPFRISLGPLGVFPSPHSPRVLWAGLIPHQKIIHLQKNITAVLLPQFPPDKKFHPHITLARIKKITNKKLFLKQVQETPVDTKTFTIHSFELIQSILQPGKKPVYNTIEKYPLSNP